MREDWIAALRAEADRVRESGMLGRSASLNRLFDFLLERSAAGAAPKEVEVAQEVFGKPADLDLAADASVRVYVHRLRRKLEDHYRDAPEAAPRLIVPRGEYRLALSQAGEPVEPATAPEVAPPLEPNGPARDRWRLVAGMLLVALLLTAGGWLLYARAQVGGPAARAARTALWAPFAESERPTFVVLGDYYIFGEAPVGADVTRLIREFTINSRDDLDRYLMEHPKDLGRLVDLDLHYLPVGAAAALNAVLPVVDATVGRARARVITASQLTPDIIKGANIIYVGYLSGLGLLRDPVFASASVSIGANYDELVDDRTGRHYISDWGEVATGAMPRRDYGYLASLSVPGGGRLLVIAGTRDAALAQTAEMASDPQQLAVLDEKAGDLAQVEALYEVGTLGNTNLAGRLLIARRHAIKPPSPVDTRTFPDELPAQH